MNSITFKKTANVFLNVGIISLEYYLERYREQHPCDDLTFEITKNELIIQSKQLFQVLEEVYYQMGKEVYDTVTQDQLENVKKVVKCNLYYDQQKDIFEPFPRIKNYGLPILLTNGRPKNTIKEENQSTIASLENTNKELATKFKEEFEKKGLELGSIIYFNEPYTTIPRLTKPDKKYFDDSSQKGEICYLTGEKYKNLVDINNNFVFISLQSNLNFRSFLKQKDTMISWKAMYLLRFSPKYTLYSYTDSQYESIICYIFESNNLLTLKKYYRNYSSFFKTTFELVDSKYLSNFNLQSFKKAAKDTDSRENGNKDFTEQFEILFMLVFTIYQSILYTQTERRQTISEEPDFDLFDENEINRDIISMVSFKADKFAATLRPSSFENFNQFKFTIRLIQYFQKHNIRIDQLMSSLKFLKTSDKNSKNSYRLERQIRNEVMKKVLKQESIIGDIENLFYYCFTYLCSGDYVGFKNYSLFILLDNL